MGCCCSTCSANYHFPCARLDGCVFLQSKEVYCRQHASLGEESEVVREQGMRADRCVLIHTSSERPGRKIMQMADPNQLRIRIGEVPFGKPCGMMDRVHHCLCQGLSSF